MFKSNRIAALQEIRSWSTSEVLRALHQNGLSDVSNAFSRRGMDGDGLLDLTEGRLALWKKDLSLQLIRKVARFVADINAAPEKYLLAPEDDVEYANSDETQYLNTDDVQPAKSWLHQPSPALPARSSPAVQRNRPPSPAGSDTGSWGTDFEDEDEEDPQPPPPPRTPAPVVSTLHRPSVPTKPNLPHRPDTLNAKSFNGQSKNTTKVQPKASVVLPKASVVLPKASVVLPKASVVFPKPPTKAPEFNLKFRKSIPNEYTLEDEEEYTLIDDEFLKNLPSANPVNDYPPMEPVKPMPVTSNIPPKLPFREPKFNHPGLPDPIEVPALPSRERYGPNAAIPKANIPRQSQFPSLPPREYLKKPSEPIRISPDPPRKISVAATPVPQDEDSDEYEVIADPRKSKPVETEDYLPPISRPNLMDFPTTPAPSVPSVSPNRRVSDASNSSPGTDKMAMALRKALQSRTPAVDEKEKPQTPELHKAPPFPARASSVDHPAQFSPGRPLPPTPEPKRFGDQPGAAKTLRLPYFFNVDRKRAEDLVKTGKDGHFLLRPSARTENPLTLTLWYNRRHYNINIRLRPDQRYALGTEKAKEQSFTSVEELVTFYRKEELVLYSGGERSGSTALKSSPPQDPYSPSPFK